MHQETGKRLFDVKIDVNLRKIPELFYQQNFELWYLLQLFLLNTVSLNI